jgi:hypothetical protein
VAFPTGAVYASGARRVCTSRAAAWPAIAATGSSAITLPRRVMIARAEGAFTGVSPLRESAICASVVNLKMIPSSTAT